MVFVYLCTEITGYKSEVSRDWLNSLNQDNKTIEQRALTFAKSGKDPNWAFSSVVTFVQFQRSGIIIAANKIPTKTRKSHIELSTYMCIIETSKTMKGKATMALVLSLVVGIITNYGVMTPLLTYLLLL